MAENARLAGFYWVNDGDWIVCEWCVGNNYSYWHCSGFQLQDSDFDEINEARLQNPGAESTSLEIIGNKLNETELLLMEIYKETEET